MSRSFKKPSRFNYWQISFFHNFMCSKFLKRKSVLLCENCLTKKKEIFFFLKEKKRMF